MAVAIALHMFAAASNLAQTAVKGTIDVYGLQAHGSFPVVIDGKVHLKISSGHHICFSIPAGEHQIESSLGKVNPVALIKVEPGEISYVTLEYRPPNMFKVGLGADPFRLLSLVLEHTNSAPSGQFKTQEIDEKDIETLSHLTSFREATLSDVNVPIQPLSESDIQEALVQGRHTRDSKTIGLLLEDAQEQLASATAGTLVSGYSVRVYTAKQWIQLQASIAAREMRPFSEADLEPEIKNRLLYVAALPSTPDRLTGKNMAAASNATRVVLQTGEPKMIVQPLSLEPTSVRLESAFRSARYGGVIATFPEPDTTRPFDIVVIGDSYNKHFTVKEKHLIRLK